MATARLWHQARFSLFGCAFRALGRVLGFRVLGSADGYSLGIEQGLGIRVLGCELAFGFNSLGLRA